MEQLTEQKQAAIKKMASERIIKLLIEAGLDAEEVGQMSRENLMRTLAELWVKKEAEEEGAVGGAEEKPAEKPQPPMSMEALLQFMMMSRQEEREKEEQRRQEEREKEEQRRQEEKEKEERRRQEEKELRQEEKERAEKAERMRLEKEERRRQDEKELRQQEIDLQKQQFQLQLEQMKLDRDESERRRTELMIEYERARKSDEEIRRQQIEEKKAREEDKEKLRLQELERAEEIRQEDFQREKDNLEKVEQEREEQMQLEQKKMAIKEAQLREMAIEKEERKKQLELLQQKIEQEELRRIEDQDRLRKRDEDDRKSREVSEQNRLRESETMVSKIKKIGDAMKHVLPKMPYDMMEVPLYFETVENAFNSFAVEERYWVKLLLPLMTPKARTVLNRLSFDDLDRYDVVKEHLLKEFKLTAREYRSRFAEAKKTMEETYTMFTARLKNLLNYYVRSRRVDKNYEKLFDLLVADKLKECLPPGPLQFVLTKEGTECLEASNVADLADIHVNNRIGVMFQEKAKYEAWDNSPKQTKWNSNNQETGSQAKSNDVKKDNFYGKPWWQDKKQSTWDRQAYNRTPPLGHPKESNASYTPYHKWESNEQRGFVKKRCHNCQSDQHLAKHCQAPGASNLQNKFSRSAENLRVNRIQVINAPPGWEEEQNRETEVKSVMKCTPRFIIQSKDDCSLLKKIVLQHVTVEVRGKDNSGHPVQIQALVDSGTEIPVINEDLLKGAIVEEIGRVHLQCVAGEPIPAKLVKIDVRMNCQTVGEDLKDLLSCPSKKINIAPYLTLVCASIPAEVCKENPEKFLLHPEIIAELREISPISILQGELQANVTTRAQSRRTEVEDEEEEQLNESLLDDDPECEDDKEKEGPTSENNENEEEMAACERNDSEDSESDMEICENMRELFKEDTNDERQLEDAKELEKQEQCASQYNKKAKYKKHLEDAKELKKQEQCASQYNKKAKYKKFELGEIVDVRHTTSTNYWISAWHGPYIVLQRGSKDSYLVGMKEQEHGRRIVHASMMRKSITRALSCGLIVENDDESGSVVEIPLKDDYS